MHRLVVLAGLVACDAGLPPPERAGSQGPPAPLAPVPDGAGGWYAILEVEQTFEECSNAGGEHDELSVIAAGADVPHAAGLGGHMAHLRLATGQRFVAQIRRIPVVAAKDDGWCIPETHHDAQILRIRRAAGDGAAELAQVARSGWPARPPAAIEIE